MRAMRLLLTSVNCPKGEIEANTRRHLELLGAGAAAQVDLVLLPEMSLTGYRPGAEIFLRHPAVSELVDSTAGAPALCFGLVEAAADGGLPFITQVVAAGGELVAIHRKAHLGEGEEGDFQPGVPAGAFRVADRSCVLAVCAEIGTQAPYRLGSELVLGPAAPGLYGPRRRTSLEWQRGVDWWHGSVVDDARRLLAPGQRLAVSTQSGATDDEDFPGWAALLTAGGDVVAELPDGREGSLVVEL